MLTTIVILFSVIGGGSGLAAVIGQFVTYRANRARNEIDGKSVAVDEIEKVIPGMGEIIRQWQAIVTQLQVENLNLRTEVGSLRIEIDRLRQELGQRT